MASKSPEPDCGIEMLGQLEGAMVVSSHIDDGSGLHLTFADGRVLVVAGYFAVSVLSAEVLH